jgi:excisionase family DNA binding protein
VDEDVWIRTGDAARILGTSRQHVVDLCSQGLLTYVRRPTQRRLRRTEVLSFAAHSGSRTSLNRDERQSLWLHAAVAGHLVADPAGTIGRARLSLKRLGRVHPSGMSAHWLSGWRAVLDVGPDEILQTLTSCSPQAVELRQNSPFAGVLADAERRSVLAAFRDSERSERR